MKLLALAIVCAACKGGDHAAPSTGSATPPPPAPVPAPAPPTPTTPTTTVMAFSQVITTDGVGPVNAKTDPKTVASLFAGLDAKTEHADREGHSLDDTILSLPGGPAVLHVVVDNTIGPQVFRVDAVGSMFAVGGTLRVGSTVADLVGRYSDAVCERQTVDHDPEGFGHALACTSPSLAHVEFQLDPAASPGSDGKVLAAKIAGLKFNRITWRAPSVAQAATASDTSGKPFCFEPNTDLAIDRIVATDDAVTFCAPIGGTSTCITASLATGAFTGAVGAPPPLPAAEPPLRVTSDGKQKLVKSGKTISLTDATGKGGNALSVGNGDYKCVENAQFLGANVYATASQCDKPRSAGYLFSAAGEAIGSPLDGVNLQGAKPFRMRGDRWAFHSSDSEAVLVVDVANGEQGTIDLLSDDQTKQCCVVTVHPRVAPLALTPKGKLVALGASLAVIDLSSGKAEHAWLLPACQH